MYAVDTTDYCTCILQDFNHKNLENDFNDKLNRISEWMTFNKLSLNARRTKSMTFHRN